MSFRHQVVCAIANGSTLRLEHEVSQIAEGLELCTVSAPSVKNCIPQHVSMEMLLTVMLSALNMHAFVDQYEWLLPRGMLATW